MLDTRLLSELFGCLLLPFFIIAVLGSLIGPAGAGVLATLAEGLQIVLVALCNLAFRLIEVILCHLPAILSWSVKATVWLTKSVVKLTVLLLALLERAKSKV